MAVLIFAWMPPTWAQIKSPAIPEQPTLKVPAIKPPAGRELPAHKVPAIKPPAERATAIIIPRENCGTWWSNWRDDPDANPCPANCERGERLALKQSRDGGKMRYQVNYRCYFPELVVNQPPGAMREPGAPPRTNCGTFWTARQSEPSTDANPCPANCERGELLGVKRGASDGRSHYEMWYRCYMSEVLNPRSPPVASAGAGNGTGAPNGKARNGTPVDGAGAGKQSVPVAVLSAPAQVQMGQSVELDGRRSYDADGRVVRY